MNDLIVSEATPRRLILDSEWMIHKFRSELTPHHEQMHRGDLSEVITQITETLLNMDESSQGLLRFVEEVKTLPAIDRIASKHYFLESIERQHILKHATHNLAAEIYRALDRLGAFQAPGKKGTFPYIFAGFEGRDISFALLPF